MLGGAFYEFDFCAICGRRVEPVFIFKLIVDGVQEFVAALLFLISYASSTVKRGSYQEELPVIIA
jgi:hypothetical protein